MVIKQYEKTKPGNAIARDLGLDKPHSTLAAILNNKEKKFPKLLNDSLHF